ncbi:hypothetical protein [Mesorhizobium sp.]|nr:hypothetical protein [Mesorhizobium sp.]
MTEPRSAARADAIDPSELLPEDESELLVEVLLPETDEDALEDERVLSPE